MEQLIKQTLDTIARLANSKLVALFRVLDDHICEIYGVFNQGELISHHSEKKIKFKNTPLAKIISTRQTHTYLGVLVKKWLLPFPTYKNTNSGFDCLCIPLLGGENHPVTGVAVLTQKTGISLPSERLQMLKMLAPLIAAIMEEVTQEKERLIQLATKDALTNLYTRPYFEIRLQEEVTRVHRYGGVFSILLIEIDHFKQINEAGGYKEGNRVLQEFARLLSTSIRMEIDLACRYGGKKFIVLLPNTNVDGAYILGDRIRRRCERHVFTTRQRLPLKVTVSVGVAHNVDIAHNELLDESTNNQEMNQATEISTEKLIYRADIMLQTAKQAGRNQVMAWW